MPLRFDLQVPANGRVEVHLPLAPGSQITMYVAEQHDTEIDDLMAASVSNTDSLNNPEDDEDWNNA